MHFTFTDLIDNVTSESIGNRVGDEQNDRFLYTHFAISYDLTYDKFDPFEDLFDDSRWDLYRQDTMDLDEDGVPDLADMCQNTPYEGRPVDEFGCPLDDDNDLVFNYEDSELDSPDSSIVNKEGVAQYEEDFFLHYRMYKDSIGEFVVYQDVRDTTVAEADLVAIERGKTKIDHVVVIGDEERGVSANELHKILNRKDFSVREENGKTFYEITGIETLDEAAEIARLLQFDGLPAKLVDIVTRPDGTSFRRDVVGGDEMIAAVDITKIENFDEGTVYRVQIGAFSKKLSDFVFSDVENLVYLKGQDGLYRYYAGVEREKGKAAKHRIKMISKGYDGSFIVAFENGKRQTLANAGFTVNEGFNDTNVESSVPSESVVRRELINFRVQVGAYENDIPTEVLDLYLTIGNVVPKRDATTGITKYFIGKFADFEDAEEFMHEVQREGLDDAFVIGDFNGKIVSAQTALELINR